MADGPPYLICDGPRRRVSFLVLPDGTAPARDFLDALAKSKATRARAASLLRTAQRLGTENHPHGGIFRQFDDTFWEIVCTGGRVLTHNYEGELLLVYGFLKKENKAPTKEVAAARRTLKTFLDSKK